MPKSRNELKRLVSVFNPRATNDWSKDESKFGQRMLEKMGWQKGQGLGPRNQGITENVKVQLKLDSRGLGFKITDDQWLVVEHGFADVLSQLNKESGAENISTKKANSLVSKSVTSKSRVHYHKFTRGKDVSRYNIKDLAGILGQSSVDLNCSDTIEDHQDIVQDTIQSEDSKSCTANESDVIAEQVQSDEEVLKKDVSFKRKKRKRDDSSNSGTIVTDGSSVTEDIVEKKNTFFAEKGSTINEDEVNNTRPKSRSKKKSDCLDRKENISTTESHESCEQVTKTRSKTKSRKKNRENDEVVQSEMMVVETEDVACTDPTFVKLEKQKLTFEDDCNTTEKQSSEIENQNISFENGSKSDVFHSQRLSSKAERIKQKLNLLRKLQTETVPHAFSGSNLTNIRGYGNHDHKKNRRNECT